MTNNVNTVSDAQMASLRRRAEKANPDQLSEAATRRRQIAAEQQRKASQS